jgi:allene oxide cyclase
MRIPNLLVASAGLLGLTTGMSALAGERLVLIEHALTDHTTDLQPKGDSAGDLLTFANPVFMSDNRTQIGRDQGYCVRVEAGKSWECLWTLRLEDGQITVQGPFDDSGDTDLTITGGTGKYAGARGTMHLHARDAKGRAYDFIYTLL